MSNTRQATMQPFCGRKIERAQGMVDVAHIQVRVSAGNGPRQTP
jgi:hypothetical protein